MALAKIIKFQLITLTPRLNSTMKKLQKLKIAQIIGTSENNELSNREISQINSKVEHLQTALKILEKYPSENSKASTSPPNLSELIIETDRAIDKLKAANIKALQEIKSIIPYESSEYSLNTFKTLHTTARHGYFMGEVPENSEHSFIHILKQDNNRTYVWLLQKNTVPAPESFTEFVKQAKFTPKEFIEKLHSEIEENNKKIQSLELKLTELSSHKKALKLKKILKKKELEEEKTKLISTEKTSVITGYIVSKNSKLLKKEFPEAFIHFSEADKDAPVAFENNLLVSPVEGITESYTMPSSQDIDPNPIMAFFYYLFFGMMFSDAGYGLLMIIVCGYGGFIGRSKIKKMLRMFFFCGISTLFWGLMYGSFFGNAITSIGEIFLGRRLILRPLWINPTQEPLTLLIFSIALGFIQILTGLCIKFYIQLRHGRITEGLLDTGSWILTLSGLGILSAGIAYEPLTTPGVIITAIGALSLVTTQGRDKKNIFLKITGGFLSLYNITSYISDILSYSRLMALGLATGVIAEVVNILGGLGGNSLTGIIMYILIFIIGHSLNFAINMLGAYVHTNRLQYVEFYSKFYEGGGRAFVPFGSRY